MDIVRNLMSLLFALISRMNATHYSDAASQRAVRLANRRKNLRRIAVGAFATCLVAGVIAVESPREGGLLSKLGLFKTVEAGSHASVLSDEEFNREINSRRRGGLRLTTGFYEFDDGPEEDHRKGRMARADMASTTTPYFAAEYYEDRDLAASNGFFGFWASVQIGRDRDEPSADNEGFSPANLAPRSNRFDRMRTSRERADESGGDERKPLLQRIFKSRDQGDQPEPAAAGSARSAADEPPSDAAESSKDGKRNGLLKRLFKKREISEGDEF